MKRTTYFIIGMPIFIILLATAIIIFISSKKVLRDRNMVIGGADIMMRTSKPMNGGQLVIKLSESSKLRLNPDSIVNFRVIIDPSEFGIKISAPSELEKAISIKSDSTTNLLIINLDDINISDVEERSHYWQIIGGPITIAVPRTPESINADIPNSRITLYDIEASTLDYKYFSNQMLELYHCKISCFTLFPGGKCDISVDMNYTDIQEMRNDFSENGNVSISGMGTSKVDNLKLFNMHDSDDTSCKLGLYNISVGNLTNYCKSNLTLNVNREFRGLTIE